MMRKSWIFICTVFFGLMVFSKTQASNSSVAMEGYLLEDLATHRVLAEKESTHYFTPASNLKIFTALSTLAILGEDFRYKTQIFFDPHAIHQGVLQGSVSLLFSGDPLLKKEDIATLLKALKAQGVKKIQGNVYLMTGVFDDRPYADGWTWDSLHVCYSGPINAINLDRNCFLFHVFPTKNHHPADIAKSIQCSSHAAGEPCVINQAMTSDDPSCALFFDQKNNQYTLSGCLRPGKGSQQMKVSIPNATLYAETYIKQALSSLGISLLGQIINDHGDKVHGAAMATHTSAPLSSLIHTMLKHSDNLIANALFKTAGAHYYHAQGTWMRAIHAEKAILNTLLGFDPDALFIFDGAGESYYNAVTPLQMMRVLEYIEKTPKFAKIIIPALPINGMDGTLVGRLRAYPSIIHAKTGTWRDVSALSGYIIKPHTRWAFTIFVNGMTPIDHGDARQVDAWMQKILPVAPKTSKTPARKAS